jgi:hypothetical protein
MKNKKLISFILLISIVPTFSLNAEKKGTEKFVNDCLAMYTREWAALFAHEMGHALAVALLTGAKENTVHLGSYPHHKVKMFTAPGNKDAFIKFHSIFPSAGYTKFSPWSKSKWKNVAICLAGPLCGALTYYLFNLYRTYKFYKKSKIKWTWKQLLKESLIDMNIVRHMAINLIPFESNDGAQIVRSINGRNGGKTFINDIGYKIMFLIAVPIILEACRNKFHKTLNLTSVGKKTGVYKKYADEQIVLSGNIALMSVLNKVVATVVQNNGQTDLDIFDISIPITLAYSQYPRAFKNVYD